MKYDNLMILASLEFIIICFLVYIGFKLKEALELSEQANMRTLKEVVPYAQIKRAAICWHRSTAHLQYVRYQNIMYRLFGQAERKIICIIITMLTTIRR